MNRAKKPGHLDYPLQSYVGDDGDDDVSNYIQLNAIINPWLVKKRLFFEDRLRFKSR